MHLITNIYREMAHGLDCGKLTNCSFNYCAILRQIYNSVKHLKYYSILNLLEIATFAKWIIITCLDVATFMLL